MKKKVLGIIVIVLCVLLLLLLIGRQMSAFGVSAKNLEADARENGNISADWLVSKDVGDDLAAVIFYDSDKEDNDIKIYIKHSGISFGYFFRFGGSVWDTDEGVAEYSFPGYTEDVALISMNKPGVERIEWHDGQEWQTIDLDTESPFAVIIPKNCAEYRLYNGKDEVIPVSKLSH